MDFIEVSGKNVNEAITKASLMLEIASDQLEIQVISEGSSGFLGIGSKPALIKARKKEESVDNFEIEEVKEVSKEEAKEELNDNILKEETKPIDVDKLKEKASEFLSDVFKAMDLDVKLSMEFDEKESSLNIDFEGPEMGILIGKRGQTLDSLQYITNLVVNKEIEGYVRVKLDTENYRQRRKETLENLARNISFKVKKTRKAVSLEPMNPYERRIIHSSLQGNKYVETYSEGNEPYRHVVVTYKHNR